MRLAAFVFAAVVALAPTLALAGDQQYEPMSASVRSALAAAVADDRAPPEPRFGSWRERVDWLASMSERLPRKWKPEFLQRIEFLKTARYEAQRAGLDPHLVLGLIEVESYFRRYAVSSAGARGYMQVMPFWSDLIGDGDRSRLFDLRTNLRYGCTILRHYLDLERGDLFRALGRYNGSLGRPEYPSAVLAAWRKWDSATARVPAPPRGAGQVASGDSGPAGGHGADPAVSGANARAPGGGSAPAVSLGGAQAAVRVSAQATGASSARAAGGGSGQVAGSGTAAVGG